MNCNKLKFLTITAALLTSVAVSAMPPRPGSQVVMVQGDENLTYRTKAPRKVRDQITNYPATGERHVLVVLAAFADKKFHSADPAQTIGDMLNKPGYSDFGATGSVRDYFIDNSAGQYQPVMDVFGPVTLPREMAYYGGMTATANDARPREMIRDACQLLDDQINFKDYDLDGDGYIDNVYLFYPGYSQADGADPNTVWPHASYAWDQLHAEFDGVRLDHYACSNEIELTSGNLVGIGTFCHEFSHVLGLPDLYPTDYSHNLAPGAWSLMANGGYNNNGHTPPYLTAYERYALGWLTPEELTADGGIRTLAGISTNTAYKVATDNENEYFLLENRRQDGWDAYLPGSGMLVWHIDYDRSEWAANTVNNSASHQRIDLVEADRIASDANRPGDAYPGANDVTEITAFKPHSGAAGIIGVYNILETAEGNIQFHCINTSSKLPSPEPALPTDVSPVSFTLNWNAVEGADSYVVDVYTKERSGSYVLKNYVDGCRLAVTDECSLTAEGLKPLTEYFCTVRAMGNSFISDRSEELSAKTADKDFTFFAPRAESPANISATRFTARWDALDEAIDYEVNVYEVAYSDPITEGNDISDGISGTWASSTANTSVFPGYYGTEAPGLTLTANDDFIRSPLHTDAEITKIAFWYRGTSVQDRNELEFSGYTPAGNWEILNKVTPVLRDNPGYNVEFDFPEIPCHSVAIIYRRPFNAGSVAIDDIQVEYSATTLTPLSDYSGVKTGGALELEITGLKPATRYRYEVRAFDGKRQSLFSTPRNVKTLAESAISTITADNAADDGLYDLQGRRVINPRPGLYIRNGRIIRN